MSVAVEYTRLPEHIITVARMLRLGSHKKLRKPKEQERADFAMGLCIIKNVLIQRSCQLLEKGPISKSVPGGDNFTGSSSVSRR